MAGRTRKLGTLVAMAATTALAFSFVAAHASPAAADTDDKYKPAGSTVTGVSSRTVFALTGGVLTVTCTHSQAGGKTPATGIGKFAIQPLPVFNDGGTAPCQDTTGATDKTTTKGAWTIGLIDAANDETATEPNTDQLQVTIPIAGAVVKNTNNCTITVAPSAPVTVTGSYNDKGAFSINNANIPIKVTPTKPGAVCPTFVTSSSFTATYNFTPAVSDAS